MNHLPFSHHVPPHGAVQLQLLGDRKVTLYFSLNCIKLMLNICPSPDFNTCQGGLLQLFHSPYHPALPSRALLLRVLLHVHPWGHASEKTLAAMQHPLCTTPEEVLLFVITKCVTKGRLEKKEEREQVAGQQRCGCAGGLPSAASRQALFASFACRKLQNNREHPATAGSLQQQHCVLPLLQL